LEKSQKRPIIWEGGSRSLGTFWKDLNDCVFKGASLNVSVIL
jgi:hypothetical protein